MKSAFLAAAQEPGEGGAGVGPDVFSVEMFDGQRFILGAGA